MLEANEVRDKYQGRQRGTDLEKICQLMDANGITLMELTDYIDKKRPPSVISQVQKHRKRMDAQRRFTYGRTVAKQSSKSAKEE